jgi:hypothetical protein
MQRAVAQYRSCVVPCTLRLHSHMYCFHRFAAERFYPCSGPDSFPEEAETDAPQGTTAERNERIVNIALTPIGPGPWDRKARAKLTSAQREVLCKEASAQFRAKVSSMLLPRIEKFNADLIFISAGFDAHYDDMYHFLTEQDLHWVTEELCAVAGRSGGEEGCAVISVLEGGYSLSTPIAAKPAKVTRGAAAPATSAAAPVTAPAASAMDSTAAAGDGALGRGGRQKAKKAAQSGAADGFVESPEGKATPQPVTTSAPEASVPPALLAVKGEVLIPGASPGVGQNADMHSMYAQRPGDGGLVKG